MEHIALRVFWTCMLLCASSALAMFWLGDHILGGPWMPTFFIIGFASFLLWAPLVVYRFLDKLR